MNFMVAWIKRRGNPCRPVAPAMPTPIPRHAGAADRRNRRPVAYLRGSSSSCQLVVKAERAEHHPRVFTAIHVHFILGGDGLQQAKVERAIKLSAQKYCSASIMLGQAVPITHDYELHPAT